MTSALNQLQVHPLPISRPGVLDGISVIGRKIDRNQHFEIIHFDPHQNVQSSIGRFPFRPNACLASLEYSLFLIGGEAPYTAEVAAFDVVEKRHRNVPHMLEARGLHAVASSTRAILVCGGRGNGCGTLSSCELFQPARRRWISMPPMKTKRAFFQVVWLPDGRIFAMGGASNSVEMLHREWTFDGETTDQWRRCNPMRNARTNFSAVVLHGDVVLVAGVKSVELFTPPPAASDMRAMGQWTNLQLMPSFPSYTSSGVFSDGGVFIFEDYASKIHRFRPSPTIANPVEFTDWIWDEELSVSTVKDNIRSVTFK